MGCKKITWYQNHDKHRYQWALKEPENPDKITPQNRRNCISKLSEYDFFVKKKILHFKFTSCIIEFANWISPNGLS